jgi:hypothetical protein
LNSKIKKEIKKISNEIGNSPESSEEEELSEAQLKKEQLAMFREYQDYDYGGGDNNSDSRKAGKVKSVKGGE